ncbi:thiol-disulfide oxidoreductase YkuV [Virgibacillus pantothenticus]|uniref:TlpA family protein disulfide reductase n=1 Tax=Virgibacillus TaxID=84406 RepID=UPI000909C89B|nr:MULTISPECIES: TlpA disulfide reductase family protein [Virgibacillus]API93738.1 hypothetical protein BKP57_19140 [Virgibacillus sp. 6R]MBS7429849.1 TlpA family protein disulfide reductase [Virgibacillus sp. 19R1-5]MBU8565056.1 TlpA family protein disulfide reductase [Virgibacillus pantothenticus]MBU8599363.1 TlpA family protein disulfide reductase [Virgibacillus pantothenticus]MBU8633234.1 TlpA family protein disulfide reductase [Virgibacillus pantothenticus]
MRLGQEIPEFVTSCEWLNSRSLLTEDIRKVSKPCCFHFWAISCGLCKQAMPRFKDIYDKHKHNVQFISVHTPLSEKDKNMDEIGNVVEEYHLKQPIAVDHHEEISEAFHVKFVPAYYLFDDLGKLRHLQRGKTNVNLLEKNIQRLI